MAVFAVCLVVFLAMTGYSSAANYCVCNNGVSDSVLQKNIDYACGNGADCTQILQNGPCYQPNTIKDHCNYAVNSYFQRKGQVSGSCNFENTASVLPTPPTSQSSTCVYPSSASSGTTPTGGTTTPGGTTGGNTGTGGTTGGNTGTGGTTGSTTGGTTGGFNPNFGGGGLGPSTGGMNTDNSSTRLLGNVFLSLILPLLLSGFVWLKL